ncbi:MAG: AAA family ATPase [Candidatus Micrarchaeota archaeon]
MEEEIEREKGAAPSTRGMRSLRTERMRAGLLSLFRDESLANALLVVLGCAFLLLAFKLYPLPVIGVILLAIGVLAYKFPPGGVILGAIAAFPAVAYQSPVFAWLYILILAMVMFEAFRNWHIIAALMIIVLAPFTPAPFELIGGIIIPVCLVCALMLGSKKSIAISIPAVFLVLLLSALWGVQNSSFVPLNMEKFSYLSDNYPYLWEAKEAVEANQLIPVMRETLLYSLSTGTLALIGSTLGVIGGAVILLFIADSAFIQLIFWSAALFLAGSLPARIKSHKQLIASFPVLLIPLGYTLACENSGVAVDPLVWFFAGATIVVAGLLEAFGIDLTREISIIKAEKASRFSKFGLEDLSTSAGGESLKSIGGYEDVKKELVEAIIWPLKRKELASAYGLKPPNGILLFGPPGCGKTMLMRALSREMDIGFYYVKCSELLSEWYGETEKNITELFAIARKNAPCVLFFDEIDSIGKERGSYSSDDIAPRLLSLFLTELDGFKSGKNVIIVGATNVPQQLDKALIRPGRFDKIIYMQTPDKKSRAEIFKRYLKKLPLAKDINFEKLAEKTARYSGADIANVCRESAREAAREALDADAVVPVSMEHILGMLKRFKPSISLAMLDEYEQFKLDFERRGGESKKEEDKEKKVSWGDVIGLGDVKQALLEAIEIPLLHEELIEQYKVKPSKGLLLFGPPGCGKTMIVKAAANEINVTFIAISGAELLKRGYDGAVGMIREQFNRARENAPAIIFIDEVESVAPSRERHSSQLLEGVVAQLLNEMDGVKELKKVMLIGATNKPGMIDSALMRPGRFDKVMFIPPQDEEGRKGIFEKNLEGIPLGDTNFEKLAKITEGYSGADIASICQEAKMRLVRERVKGKEKVELEQEYLEKIISRRKPSITVEQLREYLEFVKKYGERK